MNKTKLYDVLIVGGGLVGASLACALSRHNLRIAVIEPVSVDADQQPSFDDRSLALAYGSRRIFESLGLWESIFSSAAAIRKIHVSDRGHFGVTRLNCQDYGVDALGHVVESRVIGRVLHQQMGALTDVDYLCPAKLVELDVESDLVTAHIETDADRQSVQGRLLVGADGSNSVVREWLGIPMVRWDYDQAAVITNVITQLPHQQVAYERFTDSGPLAMLPLPQWHAGKQKKSSCRCSVVWTVREQDLSHIMELDDDQFLSQLQDRFGFRLGRIVKTGRRQAYPLSLLRAKQHISQRIALIGNAAHTLHPIAGQGFNLGIRDVAALSELIVQWSADGGDVGDSELLERYAKWRRTDHQQVIALTDVLARLFSNPLLPVILLRDLGLVGMDVLPWLKNTLTRRTMGLSGVLPKLARGLSLT